MASLSSWRERNTPRLRRLLVSFAKKLSTALSQEVGRHRLKLAAVGGTQSNVGSLVHSSNSHTRVHQRMPKQIEMSDLVH